MPTIVFVLFEQTGTTPRLAQASSDCSSFFRTTVTPCPVTSTITQTETLTAPTVVTITSSTALSTQTSTEFTIVSSTAIVTPAKRAEGIKELNERVSGAVTAYPLTATPSSVPTYASACSGTVRYSSACSCLGGIVPQATTLSAVTVFVTATATAIATPTITSTTIASSLTTTTKTITSTSISQATCTPNSLYELNAVDQDANVPIDIVISIDLTSTSCANGGFYITNICGTFDSKTVTYNPADNLGGGDQCFYTGTKTVDGGGLVFRIGNDQVNIFSNDNDYFDSDGVYSNAFGGSWVSVDCSSSRAACIFSSRPLT